MNPWCELTETTLTNQNLELKEKKKKKTLNCNNCNVGLQNTNSDGAELYHQLTEKKLSTKWTVRG